MSFRPHAGGVATLQRAPSANRLASVLATGLNVRPTVEFSTKQDTRNLKRLRMDFPDLPDDITVLLAKAFISDDPCSRIGDVCRINTAFAAICEQDDFWKLACKIKNYDREDRTTGFHEMDKLADMPWK